MRLDITKSFENSNERDEICDHFLFVDEVYVSEKIITFSVTEKLTLLDIKKLCNTVFVVGTNELVLTSIMSDIDWKSETEADSTIFIEYNAI